MRAGRLFSVSIALLGFLTVLLQTSTAASTNEDEGAISPILTSMNERLAARGLNVRVAKAAWVSAPGSGSAGQTIFADDRSKQLDTHWVPGDPRRGSRTTITYLVDQSDGAANPSLTSAQTEGAIDRAMNTWASVGCGALQIVKVSDPGFDPDIADGLFGFGDIGQPLVADIVHAGWLPGGFFDALFPGGSTSILGITFSFFFIDPPTGSDINGDRKLDTAFREIYYNNAFPWAIDTAIPPVDVETVALHEAGHGLSQDHFGMVFETDANGQRHFAPFAVMNAVITQQVHTLQGSDNGGHCSIWGTWPH